MYSFSDFRDKGLLWALNRHVFHPRGLAVAFHYDDGLDLPPTGWSIEGDGMEAWSFGDSLDDEGFEKFQTFLLEVILK
jgi:hypothetical protein